mgnify:CR=1 FL=1
MDKQTPTQLRRDGRQAHSELNHDGDFETCEEWVCIAYRARARQVALRDAAAPAAPACDEELDALPGDGGEGGEA